jgi:hypothetical protein
MHPGLCVSGAKPNEPQRPRNARAVADAVPLATLGTKDAASATSGGNLPL